MIVEALQFARREQVFEELEAVAVALEDRVGAALDADHDHVRAGALQFEHDRNEIGVTGDEDEQVDHRRRLPQHGRVHRQAHVGRVLVAAAGEAEHLHRLDAAFHQEARHRLQVVVPLPFAAARAAVVEVGVGPTHDQALSTRDVRREAAQRLQVDRELVGPALVRPGVVALATEEEVLEIDQQRRGTGHEVSLSGSTAIRDTSLRPSITRRRAA